MGVAGLWDILRPAGKPRSLTHLAVVDGFEANSSNLRGLRIGIDASIWFFHAAYGREGENPELRTLFFRCTRLLSMPFLPLFVFDGPKRPSVKRGKRITGNQHWLTNGMKEIIEAFGFEWRMAPGEAEAELAYLNDIGVIDAILSDDVDNFLFGAKMVVRNPNSTLSGNRGHIHKNADGRDDGNHSIIYKSQDLLSHPSILLSRGGLILIGLLSGGDYDEAGLDGCGPAIAHGLAKCGFGEQLLEATRSFDRDELANFLVRWRQSVREELRTNSRGYLGKKKPTLAKAVTEDFPDIDILLNYTNPITSGTDASARRTHVPPKWDREPDLGKIAHLCEVHFEWGMKDIIIKRFRTVLWPSMVLRILRRATLEADIARRAHRGVPGTPVKRVARDHVDIIGTPSKMLARYFSSVNLAEDTCLRSEEPPEGKLIVKIHSKRTHASTDGILEYRLEIAPAQLVHLSAAGVQGIRKPADTTYDVVLSDDEDDEDEGGPADGGRKGKKKASGPVNPESHLRIWMPASMVQQVRPDLVEAYEATAEKRLAKKAGTSRAAVAGGKAKGRSKKATTLADDEDDEIFDLNEGVLSGSDDGVPVPQIPKKSSKSTRPKPPKSASSGTSRPATQSRTTRKDTTTISAPVPSGSTRPYLSGSQSSSATLYEVVSEDETIAPTSSLLSSPSKSSILKKLDTIFPSPVRTVKPAQIPSTLSSTSPLRPFPMKFEEESSDDEYTLPVFKKRPTLAHPPPFKPGQRRPRPASPSELEVNPLRDIINKSPRTSSVHTTPRKNTSASSPYTYGHRSPSPTPGRDIAYLPSKCLKPISHSPKQPSRHLRSLDDSVIDISSDSESETDGNIVPLLFARAKVAQARKQVERSQRGSAASRRVPPFENADVIDLT